MRPTLTTGIELAGLACIVAAVALWSPLVGLAAFGAALLAVAWGLSR
ncbi:MAG TPA: hypothetical protein VFJ14_01690 [Nocardioidaceae bacterium]|nr:hypothetical protein [Nocardioidaceae bacterium]